jgi:hypothetical protein
MSHRRWSRLPAALVSISVLGSLLVGSAGGTFAATTRFVSFASPGALADLTLLPSTTMPGGVSAYDVTLQNISNGTLTQGRLSGGDQTPNPCSNPLFIPAKICTQNPDGSYTNLPPLPSGTGTDGLPWTAKIAAVYIPPTYASLVSCTFSEATAPYTGFSCAIANLANRAGVSIRILVQFPSDTPPSASGYPLWNAAQWKEGQSSTGSNSDAAYALGYAPVANPSCAMVNKFFPKDLVTASLSNTFLLSGSTGSCDQTTTVTTANGTLGTYLTVGADLSSTQCLAGYKCFGGLSIGHLLPQLFDPTLPPPPIVYWYVKWTWSALLPKTNPKGIIHFKDDFDPSDSTTYDIIPFSAKGNCVTSTSTGCWTSQNSTSTFFEVFFQTLDNGSGRGY